MTFSSHDHGDQDEILISTMQSLELAHRKNALAQQEVNSARNNQARLESQIYELDQSLAEARKESQRQMRAKKDSDRLLEQNNAALEKERALWAEREAELTRSLKFATRPLVVQAPAKEEPRYVDNEPMEILPPQIQQQIAESNAAHTRALRAQTKMVANLRQQILTINQDQIERQQNINLRESELRAEISQTRELNRGLMEENESYQLLLHEKSMNGEFMQTSIMKSTGYDDDMLGSSQALSNNGSINLADELGRAFSQMPPTPPSERSNEVLIAENKSLKDQNAALNLYITKILTRIMQTPMLTSVLAADYSPGRTAVPESPPAVISKVNSTGTSTGTGAGTGTGGSGSNNSGSDTDSKKEERKQRVPETGRARSQSLLSKFSWTKPTSTLTSGAISGRSSNRSSSEDDSASGKSVKLSSFQEGVEIDDSPRTSYSSSDYAVVSHDRPAPLEYEPLTTFDKPYTRSELRRHATLSSSSPQERHQRRQTIGASSTAHLPNGSHGRYVSESSAVPTIPQGRRSMLPPAKNNMSSTLPPMPESRLSISTMNNTIPVVEVRRAYDTESMESNVRSPTLSIATSHSSSSSHLPAATAASGVVGTEAPTTPVKAESKWRRWSVFGSTTANPPSSSNNNNNMSGSTATLQLPTEKFEDTRQTVVIEEESTMTA
ncbi:hypothetical protein EDD21DRAFT_21244 [Dissophora ornata]|nr:hypothetical protein EDD21DRAFT_21244 [Dissophora ornata]